MTRQVQGPGTDALEREYVYADPAISLTDLAERHGLARSNVTDKARIGHWFEKREEFRRRLADETRDALAEKWAQMQVAVYERLAKTAGRYLDIYEQALESGDIKPSTKDMIGIAAMMRTITGDMAQRPVANVVVGTDGEVFEGTADDARMAIEKVKELLSGKTGE
jgi:hypothetical protein